MHNTLLTYTKTLFVSLPTSIGSYLFINFEFSKQMTKPPPFKKKCWWCNTLYAVHASALTIDMPSRRRRRRGRKNVVLVSWPSATRHPPSVIRMLAPDIWRRQRAGCGCGLLTQHYTHSIASCLCTCTQVTHSYCIYTAYALLLT